MLKQKMFMQQNQTPTAVEKDQYGEISNFIWVENELSRYPVHNLAKKGNLDISVTTKNELGQVTTKWKVTPNRAFGKPGPLAYKVDTVIINQKIDAAGRPLPDFICLGSLYEIASHLGLKRDTNSVKKALLQNASLFIEAKIIYQTTEGVKKTLEAVFSRYSFVFTGESLPNGQTADAVYVVPNKVFKDVLDTAPRRPQDLDYIQTLTPGAHRFYHLIGRNIFATLNNPRGNQAMMLYSDYCARAPQERYFELWKVKRQMKPIHLPHIKAGYITEVKYQKRSDEQGRPDWMMCYTPGLKAKLDHAQATGKQPRMIDAAAVKETTTAIPAATFIHAHQKKLPLKPTVNAEHLDALTSRGVTESMARKTLDGLPADFPVLDTIEWVDFQDSRSQEKFTPGMYIHVLRERSLPPATFETTRAKKVRQEAEEAQSRAIVEQQQAALAAEEAETAELNAQIEELTQEARLALLSQAKAELLSRQPKMAHYLETHPEADSAVRARARTMLKDGWSWTPPEETSQSEEPHYAINPLIRQGTPLQESATAAPVLDLERILKTPQLTAPADEPEMAAQPAKQTIEDHLL